MKYLISNYGSGISVGLLQSEGAEEDINLAHNLFNCNADLSLFHGSINFPSLRTFQRFLIYKKYLWICSVRKNAGSFMQRLRHATKLVKREWGNVQFDNFMQQIRANSNNNYSIGSYQDDAGEE